MTSAPRTDRAPNGTDVSREPSPPPAPTTGVDSRGSFDHAWCLECTWRGPARRARASARQDLARHLVADHAPPE